jgi:hypothetical protein
LNLSVGILVILLSRSSSLVRVLYTFCSCSSPCSVKVVGWHNSHFACAGFIALLSISHGGCTADIWPSRKRMAGRFSPPFSFFFFIFSSLFGKMTLSHAHAHAHAHILRELSVCVCVLHHRLETLLFYSYLQDNVKNYSFKYTCFAIIAYYVHISSIQIVTNLDGKYRNQPCVSMVLRFS